MNFNWKAVYQSFKALEFPRRQHRLAVKQYAGAHWSEETADEKVPVNLLAFYVNTITRHLIAKSPRVMISTFNRDHKPVVAAMQSWVNRQLDKMSFADTVRRAVLDALFSYAVVKVALTTPMDSAMSAWARQTGTAGAWHVDLEDFVFDIHARTMGEAAFYGHRYRAPLAVAREYDGFNRTRKHLTASTDPRYDQGGAEKTSALGRTQFGADTDEFEEMVDLWEIYVPRHRMVFTFTDDDLAESGLSARPLGETEWLGPESGPYKFLGLETVPGSGRPKGPIMDLVDIHTSVNYLYRKLIRQAHRQKEVGLVAGSADEDGNRIMAADDGSMIRVNDPRNTAMVNFGGANQQTFAMAEHLRAVFNELGGNLSLLAGIAPQSGTASQDEMLNANASTGIADKQQAVLSFTADIVESLCWYWFHDPFSVMRVHHAVPGAPDIAITRQVTPEQRFAGRWEDLDIRLDPYSMQHTTPQTRAQMLLSIVKDVAMPMLPLLQAQGIMMDLGTFFEKLAEYVDQPDLKEILTVMDPPEVQGGTARGPGMPQSTSREYVRRNVSQRTARGDTQNRVNTLMGVDTGGDSQVQSPGGY